MKHSREYDDATRLFHAINNIDEKFIISSSQTISHHKKRMKIAAAAVAACMTIVLCAGALFVMKTHTPERQTPVIMSSLIVTDVGNDSITAYSTKGIQIDGTNVPVGKKMEIQTGNITGEITKGSIITLAAKKPMVMTSSDSYNIVCDSLEVNAYIYRNEAVSYKDFQLQYDETLIIGDSILNYDEDGNYSIFGIGSEELFEKAAKEYRGTFSFNDYDFEYFASITDESEIVNMPNIMKKHQFITDAQVVHIDGDQLFIEISYPHANDRSVNKGLVLYSVRNETVKSIVDSQKFDVFTQNEFIHSIDIDAAGNICLIEAIENSGTGKTSFYIYDTSNDSMKALDSETSFAWLSDNHEIMAVEENDDMTLNIVSYNKLPEKRYIAKSVMPYTPESGGFVLPTMQNGKFAAYCIVIDKDGKMSFFDFLTGELASVNDYYYPINAEAININNKKTILLCQVPNADGVKCICTFDYSLREFSVCELTNDAFASIARYYAVENFLVKIDRDHITVIY